MDMNVAVFTNKPVEHILWLEGDAPLGQYQVIVEHFATRHNNPLPTDFVVAIKINDKIREFKLKAHEKEQVLVHTFEITEKDLESVGSESTSDDAL